MNARDWRFLGRKVLHHPFTSSPHRKAMDIAAYDRIEADESGLLLAQGPHAFIYVREKFHLRKVFETVQLDFQLVVK